MSENSFPSKANWLSAELLFSFDLVVERLCETFKFWTKVVRYFIELDIQGSVA